MSFSIDYPHRLGDDEARERVRALADYLSNKHGLGVTWDGPDRANIRGKYMIVEIDGSVRVEPGRVRFDGKDPGFLWRGKAKEYLTGKLAKYLDPKTLLDALPRR